MVVAEDSVRYNWFEHHRSNTGGISIPPRVPWALRSVFRGASRQTRRGDDQAMMPIRTRKLVLIAGAVMLVDTLWGGFASL